MPIRLLFPLLVCFLWTACTPPPPQPPNVLLIISDDQGWSDYGFMGHPHIETPHLDELANESLTFTRGYVSAPLCRPSLATMASGLYPHQHGVTGNDPTFEFPDSLKRYRKRWLVQRKPWQDQLSRQFYRHPLLPQILSESGYLSLQTGKWWEGSWEEAGFTHGMTHGDPERGGRHGDAGLSIGREGLEPVFDLIDTAQQAGQPFFIWYAPFLPHSPHTPPEALEAKYLPLAPSPAVAKYWAMCEWFDQTIGELRAHLENKGLTEETLVVYVCDNGWIQAEDRPNRYAARSKRSPYEMGIRTPILFHWPEKIAPQMDTTTLVGSIDLLPTILGACDLKSPAGLPGLNVLDEGLLAQRKLLFASAFAHDIPDLQQPAAGLQYQMALSQAWKLILPNADLMPEAETELFQIQADPQETTNLATSQPDTLQRLQQAIQNWWNP